jgi:hypothetical protein
LFGLALPIPRAPLLGCGVRPGSNSHVAVDGLDHVHQGVALDASREKRAEGIGADGHQPAG